MILPQILYYEENYQISYNILISGIYAINMFVL